MPRPTADRIALVREMLKQYELLQRRNTDEIGWVALKLSCGRLAAARLVQYAKEGK